MNRYQKRIIKKWVGAPKSSQNEVSRIEQSSLKEVCEGIQFLLNDLKRRGYPVYDFDSKDKVVQEIKIIGDKVYFLAGREG